MTALNTVGELAAKVGAPLHRIEYILTSRDIRPAARVGNYRMFDERGVEQVRHELRRIDRERGRHVPAAG